VGRATSSASDRLRTAVLKRAVSPGTSRRGAARLTRKPRHRGESIIASSEWRPGAPSGTPGPTARATWVPTARPSAPGSDPAGWLCPWQATGTSRWKSKEDRSKRLGYGRPERQASPRVASPRVAGDGTLSRPKPARPCGACSEATCAGKQREPSATSTPLHEHARNSTHPEAQAPACQQ
jgi:hypothetical protein